jgi:hypothetical protein
VSSEKIASNVARRPVLKPPDGNFSFGGVSGPCGGPASVDVGFPFKVTLLEEVTLLVASPSGSSKYMESSKSRRSAPGLGGFLPTVGGCRLFFAVIAKTSFTPLVTREC